MKKTLLKQIIKLLISRVIVLLSFDKILRPRGDDYYILTSLLYRIKSNKKLLCNFFEYFIGVILSMLNLGIDDVLKKYIITTLRNKLANIKY